jgi:ethanolamine utilization protein EutQ (cupin superfamily)
MLKLYEDAGKKKGKKVEFGSDAEQYLLDLFEGLGSIAVGKFESKPGSWEEDQMYEEVIFMIDGEVTVKDRETGEEISAKAGDAIFVSYSKLRYTTKTGCKMWFVSYPPWKANPPPQYRGKGTR